MTITKDINIDIGDKPVTTLSPGNYQSDNTNDSITINYIKGE